MRSYTLQCKGIIHARVLENIGAHQALTEEFIQTGQALFGDNYRGPLSDALGYAQTRSSVRRWLCGEYPFPQQIRPQLKVLLQGRIKEIDLLIAQLQHPLPNRGSKEINRIQTLEMIDTGRILYGKMWKKILSEQLRYPREPKNNTMDMLPYSRWGTFAWREGVRDFPDSIRPQLLALLVKRHEVIAQLLDRLSQPLPVPVLAEAAT